MLLADPNDILTDLGFDQMADILAAATSALNATESMLAARLGSEFQQETLTDMFYVPCAPYEELPRRAPTRLLEIIKYGSPSGVTQTKFRLRRGFVQSIQSISTVNNLKAFGTTDEIDLSSVIVPTRENNERGILVDYQTWYANSFVKVVYTAGFPFAANSPNPPVSYDLTTVPRWLQEAAKIRAKILLDGSPTLEQAQIKIDTKLLVQELNSLIGLRVRYAPLALLPL